MVYTNLNLAIHLKYTHYGVQYDDINMEVLCKVTRRLFRLYTYDSNYTYTWGVLQRYTRGSMQARTPRCMVQGGGEIKKKNKKERANRSQLNPDCVIVCRRRML